MAECIPFQTMNNKAPLTEVRTHADRSSFAASPGRCLICLNDWHMETFFDDALRRDLEGSVCELRRVACEGDSAEERLREAIAEFEPDILLAGWSTPALPSDLCYPHGPVRYACSLSGAVRGLVSSDAIDNGLTVTNWGTSISRTIAEAALMMTLMSLRCTAEYHEHLHHRGGWSTLPSGARSLSLFGRRVGIHGFGKIARELVTLLRPFNVSIHSFCPSVPDDQLREIGVKRADSLAELFSSNDVLIELEGLTEQTRHSVNEAILRLIPDEGVLVNVGRGALIDEAALARIAAEGRIRVALDVFEEEPLPIDCPLRKNGNIVLMPHRAGPTNDRMRDSGAHAVENIKNYLEGRPLSGLITPELYRLMT